MLTSSTHQRQPATGTHRHTPAHTGTHRHDIGMNGRYVQLIHLAGSIGDMSLYMQIEGTTADHNNPRMAAAQFHYLLLTTCSLGILT